MRVEERSTGARPLPAGLRLRAWGGEPAPAELAAAMAPIADAANLADDVDEAVSAPELENWLTKPGPHYDAARDVLLAEVDGRLVGYGWTSWVDTTDGLREYRVSGYVDPDWQRRGIGHAMLDRQEAHATELLAGNPTERPVVFGTWTPEKRHAKRRLFEERGYAPVRWSYEMLRPNLGSAELLPLPEGIEIRPVGDDRAEWRRIFDADAEAFRDHWGGFSAGDPEFAMWISDPVFDPSLFVVTWYGDEVAGAVINAIYEHDNRAFNRRRGWLDSVFVRRPWRRRGLASALVARSLVLLRERGMTEAMLGVDSQNPTGALGVYERNGFVVHNRDLAYRRPLPAASRTS